MGNRGGGCTAGGGHGAIRGSGTVPGPGRGIGQGEGRRGGGTGGGAGGRQQVHPIIFLGAVKRVAQGPGHLVRTRKSRDGRIGCLKGKVGGFLFRTAGVLESTIRLTGQYRTPRGGAEELVAEG